MIPATELTALVKSSVEDDLEKILNGGLFLDRPALRKLCKQLAKLGAQAITVRCQLQGALDRKGWRRIGLSAISLDELRRSGVTIGIVL